VVCAAPKHPVECRTDGAHLSAGIGVLEVDAFNLGDLTSVKGKVGDTQRRRGNPLERSQRPTDHDRRCGNGKADGDHNKDDLNKQVRREWIINRGGRHGGHDMLARTVRRCDGTEGTETWKVDLLHSAVCREGLECRQLGVGQVARGARVVEVASLDNLVATQDDIDRPGRLPKDGVRDCRIIGWR
jgi:hypothetical protein